MIILCDIGGSKMRFARTDNLRTISEPVIVDAHESYEESLVEIHDIIHTLTDGKNPQAVVCGLAGVFDEQKGVLFSAPNKKNWIKKPIAHDVKRMSGAQTVHIVNDAALGALGEALYGAGKGYQHVAYLTVSTGVGGALVSDGFLAPVRYGSEPGHQVINVETGETLEQCAGGLFLERKHNKKPKELGQDIYTKVTKKLAVGVHNIAHLWSPDVIVMGGSQMRDISTKEIHAILKDMNTMFPHVPDVLPSELGDVNGLYGALVFAKQHYEIAQG